jgi:histidine ammonia-lyase
MTLALMGEGEFLVDGERRPAAEALRGRASRRRSRCRPRKAWR